LVIRNAVTGLKQQEVDGIIIACSDLSRVASAINFRTVVDATRILAQNTLEYARQKG
jgi:aspartate/glutamate racemase